MDQIRIIKGFCLSFVFLGFFVYAIFSIQKITAEANYNIFLGGVAEAGANVEPKPETISAGEFLQETTVSAIVVETNLAGDEKVILDKFADQSLPIASLTKLMTAVVALDNHSLLASKKISKEANAMGPVLGEVKEGDVFTVGELLKLALVASSNKSAYALAESLRGGAGVDDFVSEMNIKAQALGLENTYFVEPTGLSAFNISSAEDMAKLASRILVDYPEISVITRAKIGDVLGFGKFLNTNELVAEIPGTVLSKTGFTEVAKGCLLMSVKKGKKYYIAVVLGAEDRFSEMRKIINWIEER